MNRRTFVGLVSIGGLLINSSEGLFAKDPSDYKITIVPPLLKKGCKVVFTAPGSPSNVWEVRQMAAFFLRKGCNVAYGDTITKRDIKYRYLSKDDKFRAEELMNFFVDPTVHCIVAARGGYGSLRILNMLDYDLIRQNPKIFIGFSDVTTLINAVYKKSNFITFHGPTGNFSIDSFTANVLEALIFEKEDKTSNRISFKFTKNDVLIPGKSVGKLIGGNLSNLVTLLGTEFEFDTSNSIFFIEEVSEPPYKIDRMLKHLELAGKFKNCNGVLLGYFGKLDSRRNFYPDYSLTLHEIFEMFFKKYDFPVIMNVPFGHSSKFLTFPIGAIAEVASERLEFSLNLYDVFSEKGNMFYK
ncbi:MAG: S66 peptidase family protein [Candidatus Kapaibacteriota bacterium]